MLGRMAVTKAVPCAQRQSEGLGQGLSKAQNSPFFSFSSFQSAGSDEPGLP